MKWSRSINHRRQAWKPWEDKHIKRYYYRFGPRSGRSIGRYIDETRERAAKLGLKQAPRYRRFYGNQETREKTRPMRIQDVCISELNGWCVRERHPTR